jgi:MFS transporter, DHA2 family, multidrug resistance protein
MQRQIARLTQEMAMHAGPAKARLRAFAITDNSLNHQAQLWAYVDDFRYLALLCAFCIPLAFFFKKASKGGSAG